MECLKFQNGNFITVKDIDAACQNFCDNFKALNEMIAQENEALIKENKALREGYFESERNKQLLKTIEVLDHRIGNSFEISDKDWERIEEWKKEHYTSCGMVNFEYSFVVDKTLGIAGNCICPKCKKVIRFYAV